MLYPGLDLFIFAQEVPLTDWEIPWAGIGACLAGTGSLLTGIAAIKAAQKRGTSDETSISSDDKS